MRGTELPVLSVNVTPTTTAGLLVEIVERVTHEQRLVIAGHNLHSVYLYHSDSKFASFYDSTDVRLVDGWPVLAALNSYRRRRGMPARGHEFRVGSTDWLPDAIHLEEIQRVLVVGGTAQSNQQFIEIMSNSTKQTQFLGVPADPWQRATLDHLVACASWNPHITIIGMGMPLQEVVASQLIDRRWPGVIATVGGAIDQISGVQKNAPRWLGRYRVEWLWRVVRQPRRLAGRYFVEPFKLAALLARGKKSTWRP